MSEVNSSEFLKNIELVMGEEPLVLQALTHKSVGGFNNQRLEFLGDALIGMLVAEILYEMLPEATEGHMSLHRSVLVQGKTLAEIAREHGISSLLVVGKSFAEKDLPLPDSALEDAVEALVAAFYLSKGLAETRKFVHQFYGNRLQKLLFEPAVKPAKTRLQEFLQVRKELLPTYVWLSDRKDAFYMRCEVNVNGTPYSAEGKGKRKSIAETIAAGLVLQLLQEGKQPKT